MTNWNHYEKPLVHFGNAHEEPEIAAAEKPSSILNFAEGS